MSLRAARHSLTTGRPHSPSGGSVPTRAAQPRASPALNLLLQGFSSVPGAFQPCPASWRTPVEGEGGLAGHLPKQQVAAVQVLTWGCFSKHSVSWWLCMGLCSERQILHGEVLWEARGSAWGWKCSGSEQEGGLPSRGVRRSREKPFLSSLSDPWQRPRLGPDREGLQPAPLARGKLLPHQPLPLC